MGAVLLATLEQFTTNLGKLTFLWATVVLLGGFVTAMDKNDFYFITVLLVSYGIRSFRFLNLTKGFKKPKVVSRIQALFIVLFVLTTIVLVILWDVGLTIFVILLLVLSLLAFGYSAGSERSFVLIYNTALYNAEIFLALLNLGASIHWLRPPHYKYPKSNEFVAMLCFFSIVIAESSLFLCNRSCWQIISVRYKLRKKNNRNRPRFILETKFKFFVAVYETTLRDGAIKGLRMNLVDYVANEFLESRGNRELRKSLLMLDAVCHSEEENQRKQSGKLLLAFKREVVERLFECMGHKYYLTYRRTAISLVAEICKDENAFFAVAQVVQASDTGISLLVKALEPDTNKSVLALLGKLAAFGKIANPSVIPDFDFALGDTQKKWKDSLRHTFNGDGDDPARVDVEPEIQSSRQKIAKNLRTLLRKNHDLTRYLANALFCSSQELQELALDALAALVAYDPSDGDLLPGYKSAIHGLFHLVRACEADLRGRKSAGVLDLLCRKNRQYLETLLDGSGSSSDDVIAVLMSALSFGLDHHDGERSKHAMSILCSLHDQKLLSEEQEKALDIAKIVDMVTTMTSSRPSGHGLTGESSITQPMEGIGLALEVAELWVLAAWPSQCSSAVPTASRIHNQPRRDPLVLIVVEE
ncbi:hypothetical protein SELMODRAFT_430167 [Selaginella moellendorffii]|uniref:Uncharacterized protein n=1 Tax=Selaginella moellendorffii TaxID=88036 RepID=D8T8J9_SELML|nr:hypothetical protein SELMODRAFT_430167 [Selaginella moellendorffii]